MWVFQNDVVVKLFWWDDNMIFVLLVAIKWLLKSIISSRKKLKKNFSKNFVFNTDQLAKYKWWANFNHCALKALKGAMLPFRNDLKTTSSHFEMIAQMKLSLSSRRQIISQRNVFWALTFSIISKKTMSWWNHFTVIWYHEITLTHFFFNT